MTEFPSVPEGTKRVRPIIWVSRARGVGIVRVFADFPDGRTDLIFESAWMAIDDPRLRAVRTEAAKFYGTPYES